MTDYWSLLSLSADCAFDVFNKRLCLPMMMPCSSSRSGPNPIVDPFLGLKRLIDLWQFTSISCSKTRRPTMLHPTPFLGGSLSAVCQRSLNESFCLWHVLDCRHGKGWNRDALVWASHRRWSTSLQSLHVTMVSLKLLPLFCFNMICMLDQVRFFIFGDVIWLLLLHLCLRCGVSFLAMLILVSIQKVSSSMTLFWQILLTVHLPTSCCRSWEEPGCTKMLRFFRFLWVNMKTFFGFSHRRWNSHVVCSLLTAFATAAHHMMFFTNIGPCKRFNHGGGGHVLPASIGTRNQAECCCKVHVSQKFYSPFNQRSLSGPFG